MITATWTSLKSSPCIREMREQLKKKAEKGKPSLSRKEANRTWREDILGILSDDQKRQKKAERQKNQRKKTARSEEFDD